MANDRVRGIPAVSSTLPRVRLSASDEMDVFRSDGFTCRYCGRRTIHAAIFRELQRLGVWVYYRPGPPKSWHQIGWTHCATVDHIVPRVHERSNWVTACWQCQAAKGRRSLERLAERGWQLRDPAGHDWQGLHDQLAALQSIRAGQRVRDHSGRRPGQHTRHAAVA